MYEFTNKGYILIFYSNIFSCLGTLVCNYTWIVNIIISRQDNIPVPSTKRVFTLIDTNVQGPCCSGYIILTESSMMGLQP